MSKQRQQKIPNPTSKHKIYLANALKETQKTGSQELEKTRTDFIAQYAEQQWNDKTRELFATFVLKYHLFIDIPIPLRKNQMLLSQRRNIAKHLELTTTIVRVKWETMIQPRKQYSQQWTSQMNEIVKSYIPTIQDIKKKPFGFWKRIAEDIFTQLNVAISGTQVRTRYHALTDFQKSCPNFTKEEDNLLTKLRKQKYSWLEISKIIPKTPFQLKKRSYHILSTSCTNTIKDINPPFHNYQCHTVILIKNSDVKTQHPLLIELDKLQQI